MMTPMMVDCPEHGLQELVQSGIQISGGPGGGVAFINGTMWCPVCGGPAPIVESRFHRLPEGVVRELTLTPAQYRRLSATLGWATRALDDGSRPPEVVARRVEEAVAKDAPGLWAAVKASLGSPASGALAGWVGALVGVLSLLLPLAASSGVTPAQVNQIVEEAIEKMQQTSSPIAPETPLPGPIQGVPEADR